MNVRELVFRGKSRASLYACGVCGSLHSPKTFGGDRVPHHKEARRMAAECCAPRHCACGAVIKKYYTACKTCRERNRLQRATVIQPQDWIDPVQSDAVGGEWGEGYSSSIEAMRECCDDCGDQNPAYCWPCTPMVFKLNAESILEHALEEHHEDAADRIVDADGLYDFIEAWNAKQSLVTYYPDRTRVIVLDAERFAALIDGEKGNG